VQKKGKFIAGANIDSGTDRPREESGVVEEKRLEAVLAKLRASNAFPTEPGKLAEFWSATECSRIFRPSNFFRAVGGALLSANTRSWKKLGSGAWAMSTCASTNSCAVGPRSKCSGRESEDPSSLERFYREARAVAALDHPNIVALTTSIKTTSYTFL